MYRLGSDAEKLFPYSVFMEQFRKFGKFGAYISAMFLPVLVGDSGAVPDMDALAEDAASGKGKEENMSKKGDSDARLMTLLGDAFKDMDRLGYI